MMVIMIYTHVLFVCCCCSEGEHTRTKTIVTSTVGKLSMFTKKRSTCIGCKSSLDDESKSSLTFVFLFVVVFLHDLFESGNENRFPCF